MYNLMYNNNGQFNTKAIKLTIGAIINMYTYMNWPVPVHFGKTCFFPAEMFTTRFRQSFIPTVLECIGRQCV